MNTKILAGVILSLIIVGAVVLLVQPKQPPQDAEKKITEPLSNDESVTGATKLPTPNPTNTQLPEPATTYPLSEVGVHSSSTDCWLAISGKVYDVTEFINSHPGGQAILEGCGTDATSLYETRPMGSGTPHSSKARELLANYYIGDLA